MKIQVTFPNSHIHTHTHSHTHTHTHQALEAAVKSDVLWSKTLLSHVCSLWYVLLPPHLSNHWNKMAVLSQAFELLEDMRKSEALPNDEVRTHTSTSYGISTAIPCCWFKTHVVLWPSLRLAINTRHLVSPKHSMIHNVHV